jgi:hypothetical protein
VCTTPTTESWRCEDPLRRLAAAAARHVSPLDPVGALRTLGLELRARPGTCDLPGKCVHGAWDPLLRRIDVFECDEKRSDRDLVHCLGHELGHALFGSHHHPNAEAEADRFAELWLAALGTERMHKLAAALRAIAARPADDS